MSCLNFAANSVTVSSICQTEIEEASQTMADSFAKTFYKVVIYDSLSVINHWSIQLTNWIGSFPSRGFGSKPVFFRQQICFLAQDADFVFLP